MGFFKTVAAGYRIIFQEINLKHNDLLPRLFAGSGTGIMMIGSALMAKTAMKEDTQKVIAECDAAIEEARKSREGDTKPAKAKRIFKARVVKGLKMVKVFHKGIIADGVGAGLVGAGMGISEHGKHQAIKAAGAIGTAFASYRAAVRDDLGEDADLRYLSGRKAVKKTERVDKKTGEVTEELTRADDDWVTIKKDPSDFCFWFSRETCPSLWSDNFDLRMSNLTWVEDNLSRRLRMSKHLTLNDMRREFGGLTPDKMDVDIGGIFGLVLDPNKPVMEQCVDLGFRKDQDFMEGRTEGCWIYFPCDPKLIIGRIGKKNTAIEQ